MSENLDGGGGAPDFLATLPAEIQGRGELKGFAGPEGHTKLANSYLEATQKISSRSMADMDVPKDDAGIRSVLNKLGHAPPDSPDGYTLADKPNTADFRALAYKHGLPVKQAEAMFSDIDIGNTKSATERKTRLDASRAETERVLKAEWGVDYDNNTGLAKKGSELAFGEELRGLLEVTGLDQHPEMQRLLYGHGRFAQEGTLHTGTGAAMGTPETAAAAQAETEKFLEDNRALVMSQDDFKPGVAAAKAKYRELNKNAANMQVQAQNAGADTATGAGRM